MTKAEQIGVTVIYDAQGKPDKIVIGNGTIHWYQLHEMGIGDVNEMLGADNVQPLHEAPRTSTKP